jgi:phospholipase C
MPPNPPPTDRFPDASIVPPATPSMPGQERGVRPARPLPYRLDLHGTLTGSGFQLDVVNAGAAAAVLHVRSGNPVQGARSYTAGAGAALTDTWDLGAGTYDLSVYGPNGFFRGFRGASGPSRAALRVSVAGPAGEDGSMVLTVSNVGRGPANVNVFDRYTGRTGQTIIDAGQSFSKHSARAPFYGWYDFIVTVEQDSVFERRLAGHLEDGRDSVSDPLMGGLIG